MIKKNNPVMKYSHTVLLLPRTVQTAFLNYELEFEIREPAVNHLYVYINFVVV